jgi:hypothetical protein
LARHKFAVIALAAIALCSTFWSLLDTLGAISHGVQAFGVAAFERRYNEFRKTVQPRSVFGYISDNPPNDPSALPEFYLTQYTLAPAIVKPTVDERLVIANFHNSKPDEKLLRDNKLAQVQNFGNGIVLCRRTRK